MATLEQIKELRARTGAGITYVKEALESSGGDMEKAIAYLREKGLAKSAKRADKIADKGFIANYIHGDGMLAVLVEVNSETDFASNSEQFRLFARELAIQVAATNPIYVSIEDIPAEIISKEREIAEKSIEGNKPAEVKEKIIEGKLQKIFEEQVLLEQKYVKDDSKRIKDMLNEIVAAIGEKVVVSRFVKIAVGGEVVVAGVE